MGCIFLLIFSFLGLELDQIPDLIPCPLPKPFVAPPKEKDKSLEISKLISKETLTTRQKLELARLYIEEGNFEEAKDVLLLVDLNAAAIQLGYLYLWEDNYDDAYDLFLKSACEPYSLRGLHLIAKKVAASNPRKAICIYQEILSCEKGDADIHTELGILYSRMNEYEEAKKELNKAIQLNGRQIDAKMQLATINLWENHWEEAEKIYKKHPGQEAAVEGLAKLYIWQNEYTKAKELLSSEKIDGEPLWYYSFITKNHTDVSLRGNVKYTQARENDPSIGKPVVNDYYLKANIICTVPITDRVSLDVKPLYMKQKESNILSPTVNYNAFLAGGQITSHYIFAKDWNWDLYARAFRALGDQDGVLFPFHKTTRFEPGTSFTYGSTSHFAVVDAHVESFVTKNFKNTTSEVVWIRTIGGHYKYSPDLWLKPWMAVSLREQWFQDHNRENLESVKAGCNLFTDYLSIHYKCRRTQFKFLTSTYFSYQRQILQRLAVRLHSIGISPWEWEVAWKHDWQSTHKLLMPIGTFLFTANNQYIIGNLISSKIAYRFEDKWKMELSARYLRTTLVYRDWSVQGLIYWQF